MLELLSEYGVTPDKAMELDSLIVLRKAYASLVEKARDEVVDVKTLVDTEVTKVKQDKELVAKSESAQSELREVVFKFLDDDERLALLLVNVLQELKSLVIFERDVFLHSQRQSATTSEDRVTGSFTENREKAEKLRDAIVKLFNSQFMMFPDQFLDKKGAPKKIEGFDLKPQTERGEAGQESTPIKGTAIPDLPNLPKIRGQEETTRQVSRKQVSLFFNGEQVYPSDTCKSFSDVAYNIVSDRRNGFVIRWNDIRSLLKEQNVNIFKEDWSLELQTGKLEGKVLSDKSSE